jgi:hypothetical protein
VPPADEPTPSQILRELLVRHPDAASFLAEAGHRRALAMHSAAAADQARTGMHDARLFCDELRHRLDPRHQRPVSYGVGLVLLACSAVGLAVLDGLELAGAFAEWTGIPAIVAATGVWLTGAWLTAVARRERRPKVVLAAAALVGTISLILVALRYFTMPHGKQAVWDAAGAGVVLMVLIDVLAVGATVLIERMEPGPVFAARQLWRRARADHQAAIRLADADAEAACVAQQAWLGLVRTEAIAAAGGADPNLIESTLALAASLQDRESACG